MREAFSIFAHVHVCETPVFGRCMYSIFVAIHHHGTMVDQRAVCIGGKFFAQCVINVVNLLIFRNDLLGKIRLAINVDSKENTNKILDREKKTKL